MRQETIGEALALAGKPQLPQRPVIHKNGAPPQVLSHKGHPTLRSPALPSPLPVAATRGGAGNDIKHYLATLNGRQ